MYIQQHKVYCYYHYVIGTVVLVVGREMEVVDKLVAV